MFEVKQKVWDAMFGPGEVVQILTNGARFPVIVRFSDAGAGAEYFTLDGKYRAFALQTLFPYPVEIVAAVTKPSIDWSHVSENFQWLAMDMRGRHHLFVEKPERISAEWITHALYIYADHFASFTPGTCDWTDSLVKRPN